MTDEELKNLAIDIVNRKVLGSWMVPDNLIANIFMPLCVGAVSKLPDNVVCLYEYLDKAIPLTVNGYPTFFSFRFLTSEEQERLVPMITRYKSMNQEFMNS